MALLAGFEVTRCPHEMTQERALAWLATAHAAAEAEVRGLDGTQRTSWHDAVARRIARVACGPDRIARRGYSVTELDTVWRAGSEARTRMYAELVDAYFRAAFSVGAPPPDELIHVTCTGYASPSAAQKLVAARRWPTRVTHAYHMGCYAAIPALRIALGYVATGAQRVELVHTELCSLHVDARDHSLEQLVVQSLFADGYIRYALAPDGGASGLRVLAVHEALLPDSAESMTWIVGDAGMKMTLARDVPVRVAGALREFVAALLARAGVGLDRLASCTFAVHPGGPKIIDEVARVLELSEAQVATSRAVLRDHGNMSSATLPHIWARLLADPRIAPGTLIPSLAFGPGLSVCGALLEKR